MEEEFVRCQMDATDEEMDAALAVLTDAERGALRFVTVWSNRLTRVPPVVLDLTHLTRLLLNDNPLRRLPPELGRLTRLKKLFVERCQLHELPASIFSSLTRLTALFVNGNNLKTLPPLTALTRLNAIWTSDNPLPWWLVKDYGDVVYSESGERGGPNKVQPFLQAAEAHFLSGPQRAVLVFLCANRLATEGAVRTLPRALAAWMMREYVWSSRLEALWAPVCLHLSLPKQKVKTLSRNKKHHPKKEKKPGSGIKGFVMGI